MALSLPDRVNLPEHPVANEKGYYPSALWFTTSDYSSGGTLGRLDLNTGVINRIVRIVGGDTEVVQDAPNGIFLLHRMNQDGVTSLKGAEGVVSGFYSLPKGSNPQHAVRDSSGRIWLSTLESDSVSILAPDLKSELAKVDLSALAVANPKKPMASLAQLLPVDNSKMLVTAQRIHRTFSAWRPDQVSGLAVVDTQNLKVVSTHFIPVPNPIHIGWSQNSITVIGAGDLTVKDGFMGRLMSFSEDKLLDGDLKPLDFFGKILAADLNTTNAEPALIVWYPQENKSCVQIGQLKFVCEGSSLNEGYVFNSIRRWGNLIFVAYYAADEPQLWVISLTSLHLIEKVSMNLPILSMGFGL
jgi:hypothetical protein